MKNLGSATLTCKMSGSLKLHETYLESWYEQGVGQVQLQNHLISLHLSHVEVYQQLFGIVLFVQSLYSHFKGASFNCQLHLLKEKYRLAPLHHHLAKVWNLDYLQLGRILSFDFRDARQQIWVVKAVYRVEVRVLEPVGWYNLNPKLSVHLLCTSWAFRVRVLDVNEDIILSHCIFVQGYENHRPGV